MHFYIFIFSKADLASAETVGSSGGVTVCGVLELLGNVGEELVGDTTADNDGAIGTVVVLVEVLGQGLKGLLALGWEVDGVGSVATLEVEGIGKTALEDIYRLYKRNSTKP